MPSPHFRFLLSESRWNYEKFCRDPEESLREAVRDLDSSRPELSVYLIDKDTSHGGITDLEILSFMFAASIREHVTRLHYADLTIEDILSLGLQIRKSPDAANLQAVFYREKHHDLYTMTDPIRNDLATLIFQKIGSSSGKKLECVTKQRLKELVSLTRNDIRMDGIDYECLFGWARSA
jgi:hypothetical protein